MNSLEKVLDDIAENHVSAKTTMNYTYDNSRIQVNLDFVKRFKFQRFNSRSMRNQKSEVYKKK